MSLVSIGVAYGIHEENSLLQLEEKLLERMIDHRFDYDELYVAFSVEYRVLNDRNGKTQQMQRFLPAARSSVPVRSVVGRLRPVGGVNKDSVLEVAEEIVFE